MSSTTTARRLMLGAGPSLALASLAIGFVTAISPVSAWADECADGLTMDQTGQCVAGGVEPGLSADDNGGPDKVTPGGAAQTACQAAVADDNANSSGAQTAEIPCP